MEFPWKEPRKVDAPLRWPLPTKLAGFALLYRQHYKETWLWGREELHKPGRNEVWGQGSTSWISPPQAFIICRYRTALLAITCVLLSLQQENRSNLLDLRIQQNLCRGIGVKINLLWLLSPSGCQSLSMWASSSAKPTQGWATISSLAVQAFACLLNGNCQRVP